MRCPECNNKVVQVDENGIIRVRVDGPVEFSPTGESIAKCYWCKSKITLPLTINFSEKFILSKT